MVLRPYSMVKVTITGPKTVMETVIRELHRLKILHIVDHAKSGGIDIGSPLEKANMLSEILVKLSAIMSYLDIKKTEEIKKINIRKNYYEFGSTIRKLYDNVVKHIENIKIIDGKTSDINNKIKDLDSFKYISLSLDAFSQYKSITYFVGYVKSKDIIEEKIRQLTDKFDFYASAKKGENLIALFVENNKKGQVLGILRQENFAEFNLSHLIGMKGTALENIKRLRKENKKLMQEKENINFELNKIKQEWQDYLIFAAGFLDAELEKAEVPLRFAVTNNTFVINGWVPKDSLEDVKFELNRKTQEKVYILEQEATYKDKVPVKLKNPNVAKPFEFLMNLYALPNYKEIDPTFFTFLTFPLLFGFMLGDFGYGLTTLVVFYLLKKKFPKLESLLNILIFSSIATIFFGLLFGEFFGLEQIFGRELPRILSRSHQIMLLFYVAIAIGVVHINLGIIIGFINELSHGFFKAMNEKLSWIILQAGVALLALSYLGKILLPAFIGYAVVALAVIMLYKGEGFKGLIELPSIFSNILSYARLMALGLASVKLAEVVNEFSGEFFQHGGFSVLYGIMLLVVGHAINIGLGILGPFLHSLRLHYVEFFTKFFKGGAKRFSPFGAQV